MGGVWVYRLSVKISPAESTFACRHILQRAWVGAQPGLLVNVIIFYINHLYRKEQDLLKMRSSVEFEQFCLNE